MMSDLKLCPMTDGLEGVHIINPEPKSELTAVFLHGYGANAFDLAQFAQLYQNIGLKEWYFLQAPLDIPGVPFGKAWYPIDMDALEDAVGRRDFRDFNYTLPDESVSSCQLVAQFLKEKDLKPKNLVLGGFSQGAILSSKMVLNYQMPVAGLVVLSGIALESEIWKAQASELGIQSMRYFQSHGIADTVLPIEGARKLNSFFSENDWPGEYIEFKGQHEIPMEVLNKLSQFLTTLKTV